MKYGGVVRAVSSKHELTKTVRREARRGFFGRKKEAKTK